MSAQAGNAADLRARVTLEAPNDTPDDAGALQRVWTPFAAAWARIAPLRGAETFVAGGQETTLQYDITLRWRGDLASPMRMRYGARLFYIRAVFDPDGARRWLVCRCEEYVA
ncbi:MAG: phage head closure protein [Hyphomicrobiales bacterium]|nr:phage head closure protein [Hyphomicrobiales bacterium]